MPARPDRRVARRSAALRRENSRSVENRLVANDGESATNSQRPAAEGGYVRRLSTLKWLSGRSAWRTANPGYRERPRRWQKPVHTRIQDSDTRPPELRPREPALQASAQVARGIADGECHLRADGAVIRVHAALAPETRGRRHELAGEIHHEEKIARHFPMRRIVVRESATPPCATAWDAD